MSVDALDEQSGEEGVPEPERLGPYRLVQRLGEGGMGVVHLALDRHGRAVALKLLRPHVAHDPAARARLAREVDTLSRVRSPRVAPVVDADVDGDRPYIVTRYVPGPPLDDVIRERGPLGPTELHRLAAGLAEALEVIHGAGVIHRDLKPGNVLMQGDDPVVIDFGIAHAADDVRLTMTGLVMGTPGYLAPEVVEGADVTRATDWWGWAATVTFAASGQPPFGRGPMDAVLSRVAAGEADLTGVDARIAPLLYAALSPRPAERPHSREVVSGLERFARGGDVTDVVELRRAVPPTEALGVGPTALLPTPPPEPTLRAPQGSPAASPPQAGPTVPRPAAYPAASPAGSPAAYPAAHPAAYPGPPAALGAGVAPAVVGGSAAVRPEGYAGPRAAAPCAQPTSRPMLPAPGMPLPEQGRQVGRGAPPAQQPVQQPLTPQQQPIQQAVQHWPAPVQPQHQPLPQQQAPRGWVERNADPRIGRPMRSGTLLAGLALVVVGAAAAPVLTGLAGLLGTVLARTADRSLTGIVVRRHHNGPRGSDIPVAVAASPVHLLTSIVTSALAVLVPLIVGVCTVFSTALGIAAYTASEVRPDGPLPLAVGGLFATLMAWWGPGGTSLRRGTRSIVRGVTPGTQGAVAVSVLLLAAAAAVGLWLARNGLEPTWAPLQGSGWLGSWNLPAVR